MQSQKLLISLHSQHGERSSVGRAPDCGSGCRGFESHRSPSSKRMTERSSAFVLYQSVPRRALGPPLQVFEIQIYYAKFLRFCQEGVRSLTRDTRHETRGTRHETQDTRHKTRGTRDKGQGTRDKIRGTRYETRDSRHKTKTKAKTKAKTKTKDKDNVKTKVLVAR